MVGRGIYQSGGTNSISGYLYLGNNAGGSGTYSLSGTGSIVGAQRHNEYVGYNGKGTFTQSGGNQQLRLSQHRQHPGASGSYTLSGSGYLSVPNNENVGWNEYGNRHPVGRDQRLRRSAAGLQRRRKRDDTA